MDYVHYTPTICDVSDLGFPFCEPERMTGAAAAGDYDGDGWEDLAVSRFRDGVALYRNAGDGTFTDVTEASGIFFIDKVNNLAWVDVEHDGDLDLFVATTWGTRHYLFINDGTGVFTEEAVARGVAVQNFRRHMNYGIAFGDYNSDGFTDIYTSEWGVRLVNATTASQHGRLLRNRPDRPGYFQDVTAVSGTNLVALSPVNNSYAFAPAIVDLDQDGHPDIAIAADFLTNTLLWNNGNGTFFNGAISALVTDVENAMGSTFADYDMDGDLDWFITSIYDPQGDCTDGCNWGSTGNRLYRKEAGRIFSDATDEAGVREGGWGWGAAFYDYDNDGDYDIVMTNGFDVPSYGERLDPFRVDPMRFWVNAGEGTYDEQSEALGTTDTRSGKGLLIFDYDRDGDQDLFIVNNASTPILYRNDTPTTNKSLRMRFESEGKRYDLWNAKVWVTLVEDGPVYYKETGVLTHFLGQSERTLHFGLGSDPADTIHRVEIEWPVTKQRTVYENLPRPEDTLIIEVPFEQQGGAAATILANLHAWDADEDSALSLEEFEAGSGYGESSFDALDLNGNGQLSAAELQHQVTLHCPIHSADLDADSMFNITELLRVIQLYNADRYDCAPDPEDTEDGYVLAEAGEPSPDCKPHASDYQSQSDQRISLGELLRSVQLFAANNYSADITAEDGYLPHFE